MLPHCHLHQLQGLQQGQAEAQSAVRLKGEGWGGHVLHAWAEMSHTYIGEGASREWHRHIEVYACFLQATLPPSTHYLHGHQVACIADAQVAQPGQSNSGEMELPEG